MPLTRLGGGWSTRVDRVLAEFGITQEACAQTGAGGKICAFLDQVVTWNARTDLTAARSADELVDLFVADAALLAQTADFSHDQLWIDVGSGAGAPGLPLALLRSDLNLTLLDVRQKRVAFLRTVVGALGCEHVRVQRGRSEALRAQSVDVAISRAALPPRQWLEEGARLARSAVWVLLAKAEAPSLSGWNVQHDCNYRWPLSGSERRAVCYIPDRVRNLPGESLSEG